MANPIPGQNYTAQKGDTLSKIAEIAYGDLNLYTLIFSANQTTLKSTDPNFIYPGEVLIIPERPDVKEIKDDLLSRLEKGDGFRIEIGGREIPVVSGSIIRTMDTASDAWTATIAWEPGDDLEIDRVTRPYGYEKSKAFIDNKEMVTGPLFTVKHVLDQSGSRKELVGYSATVSIVDSHLRPDQYEQNNVSLKERAEVLLKSYGLRVFAENGADVDTKFDRVVAKSSDKIFDHLRNLAKEKQVLVSSTPKGNLLFTKTNLTDPPVGVIEEATVNSSLSYVSIFDGRKRFSIYRVTCQTPKKKEKKVGISRDKNVPIQRYKNVSTSNTSAGSIQKISDWERSKTFADALKIPFPVPSWYDPDGKLWEPGTTLIVKSKTLGVPDGYKFLIKQAEFKFAANGEDAVLTLIPPETYTGEEIKEPWKLP